MGARGRPIRVLCSASPGGDMEDWAFTVAHPFHVDHRLLTNVIHRPGDVHVRAFGIVILRDAPHMTYSASAGITTPFGATVWTTVEALMECCRDGHLVEEFL